LTGVASHEGRVLIMTTNHREKLDPALTRPGRIDHEVAFSNSTKSQIKELFERMYANDPMPNEHKSAQLTISSNVDEKMMDNEAEMGAKELSVIASEFAKEVPSDEFSPAEI
jgi:chaperone BCS1